MMISVYGKDWKVAYPDFGKWKCRVANTCSGAAGELYGLGQMFPKVSLQSVNLN